MAKKEAFVVNEEVKNKLFAALDVLIEKPHERRVTDKFSLVCAAQEKVQELLKKGYTMKELAAEMTNAGVPIGGPTLASYWKRIKQQGQQEQQQLELVTAPVTKQTQTRKKAETHNTKKQEPATSVKDSDAKKKAKSESKPTDLDGGIKELFGDTKMY